MHSFESGTVKIAIEYDPGARAAGGAVLQVGLDSATSEQGLIYGRSLLFSHMKIWRQPGNGRDGNFGPYIPQDPHGPSHLLLCPPPPYRAAFVLIIQDGPRHSHGPDGFMDKYGRGKGHAC